MLPMERNVGKGHRLAVFASGNGSNFEAIAAACADGRLDARVVLLVCDRPGAYVCERAVRLGVETFAFRPKDYVSKEAYEQDIVRMSPEAMVAEAVTSTFFPHGLGHPIGLQVHDVAGFHANEAGDTIPRPAGHPFLRMTRTLEANFVVTIEPGLYFIPMLLAQLKAGPHAAHVNGSKVDHLTKFGGIRIEDEVRATTGIPENLTRDAFAVA